LHRSLVLPGMIVLSICNHKGGTGKTTSAIHLGAALGLSGHRVLVVDLDPQSFLTRMLGIADVPTGKSSLVLFDHAVDFGALPTRPMPGFDLLPSTGTLTKRMRSLNKPTDVLWTKEAIEQNETYDVILFDTAAAVTVYSLNAMVASQHVVIPVTPEYQPVIGAEQTAQTVTMVRERLNPELHPPHFLFTQVDARKSAHRKYRQYMRKRYQERVMDTVIRTSASLARTYDAGETVFERDPYSRGARDYANATDELMQRIQDAAGGHGAAWAAPAPTDAEAPPAPQPLSSATNGRRAPAAPSHAMFDNASSERSSST